MPKKPPRRDPIIVYKREDKGLQPFLPKTRAGLKIGPPMRAPQPKPRKPKETKTVVPEKMRFHTESLASIEAMQSPEKEIAGACYHLCFLVHETKTSADLFPLKHNSLEKIFKSAHPCLTVNYVRRGDREVYHLSTEATAKWEAETGSNKHHTRMYLTPKCKVEFEEGYFRSLSFSYSPGAFPILVLSTDSPGSVAGQTQAFQAPVPLSSDGGIRVGFRKSNHHFTQSYNGSFGTDQGGIAETTGFRICREKRQVAIARPPCASMRDPMPETGSHKNRLWKSLMAERALQCY